MDEDYLKKLFTEVTKKSIDTWRTLILTIGGIQHKGKYDNYKTDKNLRIVVIANFGGYARKKHTPA